MCTATRRLLITIVTLTACDPPERHALRTADLQRPTAERIGEEVPLALVSPPHVVAATGTPAGADGAAPVVWRHELTARGATYVAPHFAHFHLPAGAYLVVRSPDGRRSRTYTGRGKSPALTGGAPGGFWGIPIPGEIAVLELHAGASLARGAVTLDRYARGLAGATPPSGSPGTAAICGADDSGWATCYQGSEPVIYDRARAVARLVINGTSACTGWLVGSQGHLLTNQHCIGDAATAASTSFEFMAEGASCDTGCNSWGACPGVIEADGAELVAVSATWDYALLKLPANLSEKYGFLRLRDTGAALGERIYVPQHPAAWGKRIAVQAGEEPATITTLTAEPCFGTGNDVGYLADTQGGSSGSPVLGYADHLVVALHHCANCPNRAVPIQAVIRDLGDRLPPDAVGDGCEPRPVASAGPDQSVCPGDELVLGTAPRDGTTYRWEPGGETTAQISVRPQQTTTYTLTATTACGTAVDSVTVYVHDADTGVPLREEFEAGTPGWSTTGLWHLAGDTRCASPGHSSPVHSMYYGAEETCTYATGGSNSGELVSPVIGGLTPDSVLRFDHFREVESYSGGYDRTEVAVSRDGGQRWDTVWRRDAREPSSRQWLHSDAIPLGQYVGSPIQLRFRFDSVDGMSNEHIGWLVDNVEVTGQVCESASRRPQTALVAPREELRTVAGTPLELSAVSRDGEDGDLTAAIEWHSSIDGPLGRGGLVRPLLSAGDHLVSASAMDSSGRRGTAAINVRVAHNGRIREDFENGHGGWIMSGLWHHVSESRCARPGFQSASSAMYYGQEGTCTYAAAGANSGELISPEISNVPAGAQLRWSYFRQVERYNASFDRTEVAISADGGATWNTVWSRDSRHASENRWTVSPSLPLSSYAGRSIRIRFRFDTVDDLTNGFVGWMLDDVIIE
jgi:hypothetical protein